MAAILLAAGLSGCLAVPLPSEGPKLAAINFPEVGETRADAIVKLGITPIFDSGLFQVYEWAMDRNFVMAVAPLGVPVGGVVERNSCRLLVEFDAQDRVARIDYSDRSPGGILDRMTSFEMLRQLRDGVVLERACSLRNIAGLGKARFMQTEAGGAPTEMRLSSGGEYLLAVDRDFRGWMIALRTGSVVDRFGGVKPEFWALKRPGFVRMEMGVGGRDLVFTQHGESTRIYGERSVDPARFDLREHAPLPGFLDVSVAAGRETFLGLESDAIVEFGVDGQIIARAPMEGLIAFTERGPELIKPVNSQGSLMGVRLQIPSIVHPDVSIAFSGDGRGLAIPDARNDYARASANRNYLVSPDGSLLIVNKVTHVEVWNCAELVAWMSADQRTGGAPVPRQVFLLPLTNKDESWKRAHVPLAMSDDGRLLAAAGVCSVSVWDLHTERMIAVAGPFPLSFPSYSRTITDRIEDPALSVQAIAISPEGILTTVLEDYRHKIAIASWRLPL